MHLQKLNFPKIQPKFSGVQIHLNSPSSNDFKVNITVLPDYPHKCIITSNDYEKGVELNCNDFDLYSSDLKAGTYPDAETLQSDMYSLFQKLAKAPLPLKLSEVATPNDFMQENQNQKFVDDSISEILAQLILLRHPKLQISNTMNQTGRERLRLVEFKDNLKKKVSYIVDFFKDKTLRQASAEWLKSNLLKTPTEITPNSLSRHQALMKYFTPVELSQGSINYSLTLPLKEAETWIKQQLP